MSGFSLFQRSTVSCMPGTHEVKVRVTSLPAGWHDEAPAEVPSPSESLLPHAAVTSSAAETRAAAAPVRRLRAVRIWLSLPCPAEAGCDVELRIHEGAARLCDDV